MNIKELQEFLVKVQKTKQTELNLSYRKISDDGAKIIAEFLKNNETVTFLSLYSNNIGNDGANVIKKSLKSNQTLTYLALLYNDNISDKVTRDIDKYLEANKQFVKDTAEFLVKKFINVGKLSISDAEKYFKHYQVLDKELLEEYLEEIFKKQSITKPQQSLVDNKIVEQYISAINKMKTNIFKGDYKDIVFSFSENNEDSEDTKMSGKNSDNDTDDKASDF